MTSPASSTACSVFRKPLATAALILWIAVAIVVVVHGWKTAHLSQGRSHTVIATYFGAGRNWIEGRPLYSGGRGFVYSPLAAASFAPFAAMPSAAGNTTWLIFGMSAFASALWWCCKAEFFPGAGMDRIALVFLFALPLAVGNFHNGQVNPLAAALLLAAVLAGQRRWFWVAAFAISWCVYLKIYPIALGMVLLAAWPRQFSWRFVIALAALAAVSFVLQRPHYVADQYRLWFATRASDDRSMYDIDIAPRDLRMLFRALHVPVASAVYIALQLGSAAAIAATALLGRFRFHWSERRTLAAAYIFSVCWMLLCGPATESATYVLLAPAVACAIAASSRSGFPLPLRASVITAFAILLCALGMNSFLHLKKDTRNMAVQPLGALVFSGFAVCWIARRELWNDPHGNPPPV